MKPHIGMALIAMIIAIATFGSATVQAITLNDEMDAWNISSQSEDGPKIGLVLSGGGAKGLAHIALLQILEDVNMPIDYIGGTSMGSIIGGLYAIGYSAKEIEQIVLTEDWSRLFSDEVSRRHIPIEEKMWDSIYMLTLPVINRSITLPGGLVSGQEIMKLFTRLTVPVHGIQDFNDFPIPFVAITTDFETGAPIVMRNGYLPDVLRASMSIPTVFTPAEIDGRTVIDGGVARNFPVTDVLEMGADYVIGINVSTGNTPGDSLNSIFSILNKTVFYHIVQTTQNQARLVDHLIEPDIDKFGMLNFDDISQIMNLAKQAAEVHREPLQAIADSLNALRNRTHKIRDSIQLPEEVFIQNVVIHDLKNTNIDVILSELRIFPGTTIKTDEIESAIDRIYSLQFFETVKYRLIPDIDGIILHIYAKEKKEDQFRVGLRYDNRTKSSLIFNATFRNIYRQTSTLRFNVRLGEEPMYDSQFYYYVGFKPKLGVLLRGNYSEPLSDVFDFNGNNVANTRTESVFGEIWTGPAVSSMLIMGVGLRGEAFRLTRIIGSVDQPRKWTNNHSLFAFLWLDTKNDGVFATNGQMVRLDYTQSFKWYGNPVIFNEYKLRWENYIPFHTRITGLVNFYSAISTGDTPLHHRASMGSYPNFPGYFRDEITGEWLKSAQFGLQLEVHKNRFITVRGTVGQPSDLYNVNMDQYPLIYGWSVSGAMKTIIGPINIALHGSDRHSILYDINVGFAF